MSWSVHLGLPRASDALSPKQPLAEGVFMSILQMQTLRLREPRVHSLANMKALPGHQVLRRQ